MGRCGPVGLFIMYKSATAPRVGGSNLGLSPSFSSRKKNRKTTNGSRQEEKRGAAQERREEEEKPAGASGMMRKAFDLFNRFISKIIKWLTPNA